MYRRILLLCVCLLIAVGAPLVIAWYDRNVPTPVPMDEAVFMVHHGKVKWIRQRGKFVDGEYKEPQSSRDGARNIRFFCFNVPDGTDPRFIPLLSKACTEQR